MKWPGQRKRRYGGIQVREDDCSYVMQIPAEKRCEWTRSTKDCEITSIVPYTDLLFCGFGSEIAWRFALGIAVMVLWLLYLFLVLGTTADNFFCPSLSVIATVLRLSENIAGVTILAFGNGAPDIFTSLVSTEDERLIIFTELIGAGVFVTAMIAGSVVLLSPFRVVPRFFIRDCCFYMFAVCWISYVVSDERVHLWESLGCILIYVLFIITVVLMQKLEKPRDERRIPTMQDPEVLRAFVENRNSDAVAPLPKPLRSRAFEVQAKLDVAINQEIGGIGTQTESNRTSKSKSSRPEGLFSEFFYDISPINKDEWNSSNALVKLLLVVRIPFMFILQLCVPVVNETVEKRGWSKLLNCLQIWLVPLAALYILELWNVYLGPVPLPALCFCFTSLIALPLLCLTSVDEVPRYHNALAFVGFLTAMLVVYAVAEEVMAVLQCIGYASGISDAMLGITLLAWGNSIGDLISNVSIARKGYPRMGFSACFGGPMFNTLLGLGLTFSIAAARDSDHKIRVRTSDMAPGCLAFLLISLLSSIIYLCTTAFAARRSYGRLLYLVYAVFMLINILSETHVILSLGVDHRPDFP